MSERKPSVRLDDGKYYEVSPEIMVVVLFVLGIIFQIWGFVTENPYSVFFLWLVL